ncbi:hypothetical protein BIFADO_00458 [Bifidobacterium adolescentis L2-32]|uniref:Transporter, auxin efflux carrier (AEC) family protein n=1 Tax=Bifidobacterium adolescentis L2-32 TaxID=411481 RepID=A7A3R4_BIFAD|nr:hypothetical protein BIFADO_00458 [Bifidobacterium adolescentis L2-32]
MSLTCGFKSHLAHMSTLIQPIALLAIILTGYLFKRAGKFKNRDYRIMQVALFNLVLPCAIIYSFATNPHDSSMLWISVFGFVVAFIPPVLIFLTTRHTPVQDRAFTMLNGSGFNIGCFCFPVVQAFLGTAAIVPAAMFDIGNCVMVAAGTNVMTHDPTAHPARQDAGRAVPGERSGAAVREAQGQGRPQARPPRAATQRGERLLRLHPVRHLPGHDRAHACQCEDPRRRGHVR